MVRCDLRAYFVVLLVLFSAAPFAAAQYSSTALAEGYHDPLYTRIIQDVYESAPHMIVFYDDMLQIGSGGNPQLFLSRTGANFQINTNSGALGLQPNANQVSVGTANPPADSKLFIYDNDGTRAAASIINAGGNTVFVLGSNMLPGSTAYVSFRDLTGSANERWQLGKTSGDDFYIYGNTWARNALVIPRASGDVLLQPAGGNVGIGTNSPSQKLDVAGNVNVGGSVAASGDLSSGNNVNFFNSLISNSGDRQVLSATNENDGSSVGIWLGPMASGGSGAAIGTNSNNKFAIYTDSTDRLEIGADGGVRFVPLAGTPSEFDTGSLYYNGVLKEFQYFDGDGWKPLGGGGTIGPGTPNRLPKFTTATTVGDSIIVENAGMIGVNTLATDNLFDIRSGNLAVTGGALRIYNPDAAAGRTDWFELGYNPARGNAYVQRSIEPTVDRYASVGSSDRRFFSIYGEKGYFTTVDSENITTSGFVGVGANIDSDMRLNVAGDASISGRLKLGDKLLYTKTESSVDYLCVNPDASGNACNVVENRQCNAVTLSPDIEYLNRVDCNERNTFQGGIHVCDEDVVSLADQRAFCDNLGYVSSCVGDRLSCSGGSNVYWTSSTASLNCIEYEITPTKIDSACKIRCGISGQSYSYEVSDTDKCIQFT